MTDEPITTPPVAVDDLPVVDARAGEPNLVTSLADAMRHAERVTKSEHNTEQKYKYASAEAILAAVREPLLERGIVLTQQPRDFTIDEIVARSGTKGTSVVVELDFTFHHGPTGETFTVERWRGQGQDYGDKAYGKAYTNAVKTFVRAQWLLPTEHDDPERDAPENVGPALPAWALEATKDRKAALLDALAPLIGRDRAVALAHAAKDTCEYVPDVLVAFARGITAHYADAQAAAPAADPAPADTDPESASAEQTMRETPDAGVQGALAADRPAPCTVDPPESLPGDPAKAVAALRHAGCVCPNPLVEAGKDTACPVRGHGIPF